MAAVMIGIQTFEVRPLNLKTLRAIAPKVEELSKSTSFSPEQIDTILDILFASLSRGNEEITRDFLEEEVSVSQIPTLLEVILGTSGFVAAKPGEALSQ